LPRVDGEERHVNTKRASTQKIAFAIVSALVLAAPAAMRAAAISADLSVAKQFNSPSPTHYGDAIDYTITVTNKGPDAASNIVLTDTIPPNTTFNAYGTGASGIVCTTPPVGGTGTISCPFAPAQASVPSGTSIEITIQLQVSSASLLTVDNTATVSSDTPDPDTTNNSATVSTPVFQIPLVPVSASTLLALGLALAAGGFLLLKH
jgi:uncharacterized repeat protein (TIGR01451 family)